jgi:Histidine phosphatase superfamily (branch 1)
MMRNRAFSLASSLASSSPSAARRSKAAVHQGAAASVTFRRDTSNTCVTPPTPSVAAPSTAIRFQTLNNSTDYNICFVRHGQSTWNRDNRFIGWTDTPLTDDGVLEARVAGRMIRESGLQFDEVHTSLLRRSIRTVNLVLMECGQEYIPVYKSWRLNERSYGDLVGSNKKEAVKQHGQQRVKEWRRSYDIPPPPMSTDHPFHPRFDPRYRHVRI